MKLSVELEKWRADRPDEWKMDEFIRNAEKLESERDALAAQVEALREALLPFASTGLPTLVKGENYSVMHDRVKDWFGVSEFVGAIECFNKTPQQHLREVRAEAVKSALKVLSHRWKPDTHGDAAFIRVSELKEHADSIRNAKDYE